MKIYHTATREDYYSLMSELEGKGCEWMSGEKPTQMDILEFMARILTSTKNVRGFPYLTEIT